MALYHSAKGSVNYTVVGSPTIVDGVVSGFSKNNYLTLPVPTGTVSSFEFVVDFTTGSKYASDDDETNSFDCVIGQETNRGTPQIEVATNKNNHVLQFLAAASGSSVWDVDMKTSVVAQLNTRYVVKFIWDGTNTYCYYKNNDEWILLGTQPLTSLQWNSKMHIGTDNATKDFFRGSINLNETYIKVNGQPWFGVCPVEVKKHQLMGPVGYTVEGSPTITDGVASGFSSSDYLSIGSFTPTTPWEAVFRVKTPFTASSKYFLGSLGYGLVVGSSTSADKVVMKLFCSSNGSSWDLANIAAIGQLELDTLYYIRFGFSGTEYYIEHSLDGIAYTGRNASSSTTNIISSNLLIGTGYGTGYYWPNEIDLNNTYIKVNDNLWFYQPAPTKYIVKDDKLVFADQGLYLTGPVTYTKVGSPTIVDGVLSGINKNNYLNSSAVFPSIATGENFDIMAKFTTPSTFDDGEAISSMYILGFGASQTQDYGFTAGIRIQKSSGKLNLISPMFGHTFDTALLTNTTYYVRFYRTNGQDCFFGYSLNKENWISTTKTSTTQMLNDGFNYRFIIGASNLQNKGALTGGKIDLNETYVILNNSLWFYDKNYATKNIAPVPAGYTYGNTTTSAIGFVDMRTQVFTAAPTGATLGRDE